MVEIRPFKSFYYDKDQVGDISLQTAPPYDLISEDEQIRLYKRSIFNIVRVVLGKDQIGDTEKNNKYSRAKTFLDEFISEGALRQRKKDELYIYGIEFEYRNRIITRYGIVAALKLSDFSKKKVLPHEKTFDKYKKDRLELLRRVNANFSPIFMLYEGRGALVPIFRKYSKKKPLVKAYDKYGYLHKIWPVDLEEDIEKVRSFFKDKQTIIADGHHRYETCLRYSKESGKEGAKYLMAMLVDDSDPGLFVMPVHRLVKKMRTLDLTYIKNELNKYFTVDEFVFSEESEAKARNDFLTELERKKSKYSFGMYLAGTNAYFLLTLKSNAKPESMIDVKKSRLWKSLDLSVLHNIVFPLLKITDGDNISYEREMSKVLQKVNDKKYEAAFLVNPVKIDQIREITTGGETMPQKSTHFFPKPLSGLVIYIH